MSKFGKVLGIVAAATLFLGACSSDDGGSDTQALVDELMSAPDRPEGVTEDDAQCVVDAVVDAVGLDKAKTIFSDIDAEDAGDDLSVEDFTAIGEAFQECDVPLE